MLCIQTSIALHQLTFADTAFCTWPPALHTQIFVDRCAAMKSECTIMVRSEFIELHRATSFDPKLLRKLCEIKRTARSMHKRLASSDVTRCNSMNSEYTINVTSFQYKWRLMVHSYFHRCTSADVFSTSLDVALHR